MLTTQDLQIAERVIIEFEQKEAFPEEIASLQIKGKTVKRSSSIYKLDPFLGSDNLVRVGGRLGNAMLSDEAKPPLILPKGSHVSELVLCEIHEDGGHFGRAYILSKLRERYWIVHANSAARRMIHKCVICKRHRAKVTEQKMADLPAARLKTGEPPFTRVGVDYFGPILIKQRRSIVKRYGVIFTCLAIRAVHIEKADSLDTSSYINALRRFIARRGPVREMLSDNGTNFVGANRELKEEIGNWNQSQIQGFLLRKGIDWKFNPPAGSHFGGVWERQIRTIRQILQGITKQQQLDDENLQTLLCEVEHIINSRPITKPSDDAKDDGPLTPNILLMMKGISLSPCLSETTDLYARKRWRQVQYMSDMFWKRWVKEYLSSLQKRQKWLKSKPNLTVGDIVLIREETTPRCAWPLGRIIKVMPDKKGLVRRVLLKTGHNELERPYDKLCVILEAEQTNPL
ncbi:uncharacterized protein LOC102802836 [Saccoglossus kowalevskii]|uniref:Uncharacterized protein LOC102802836 n=1 Tax=Saccoglossus kowalevskii TaxID=10224 RepID=A0ABM0LUE1_SACKO|nr:PREDICTED: uncharacterized protein LOC102802836 [Saccoglossus kowalevskii]